MDWRVQGDVLWLGGLMVTVQRIGLDDWHAQARLRSWGLAPIHRADAGVLIPCAAQEALWLGLTHDDAGVGSSQVELRDELTGAQGAASIPNEYQLGSLHLAGTAEPIRLAPEQSERLLELDFYPEGARARVTITLLRPEAWCQRSGREPQPVLERPPPPPFLG